MPIFLATYIAPTGGADIPMVQADRIWGGAHVVPTFASLASSAVSTTTISPNTRLAGMVAIVTADETRVGSPMSFYVLAVNLTTWVYAGSLAASALAAGSQYTFAPAANPDPVAETALTTFLTATGECPTVVVDLTSVGGGYSFARNFDFKGGTLYGLVGPFVQFNAGVASARNIGRITGGLNVFFNGAPGQPTLFYDSPIPTLIIDDFSGAETSGTGPSCVLNGQSLTLILATGGSITAANVGGPVFQATNGTGVTAFLSGGMQAGQSTASMFWIAGDAASLLTYYIDSTQAFPGNPAGGMPVPSITYTYFPSGQYTFKPTASPDAAAEATLAAFLLQAGEAPTIDVDLSSVAGTYSFASVVNLKGGSFVAASGTPVAPASLTFNAGSASLRNLGRVAGTLSLVLNATPGVQVLFYDFPSATLVVEDVAIISSTGTDAACKLNTQTLTVITATLGRLSGVDLAGPLFQLTASHVFVLGTGGMGYNGAPTFNQTWLTGDAASTLFYGLDATSVFPGNAAGGMPSPTVQYTAFPFYPNLGTLSLLNASKFSQGKTAYVASLDRTFEWFPGALPVGVALGPTTVFPDASASGFWIWQPTPSVKWQSQPAWFVDPIMGNDENSGQLPPQALQTVAEIARRTGGLFYQSTTINLVSDLPSTDRPIWFLQSGDTSLSFITVTVAGVVPASPTTSVVTAFNAAVPATNTQASITVSAAPTLTPYQKAICLVGAGPAVRGVGYLLAADGASYLTGTWADPTAGTPIVPQVNDVLEYVTPVQINRTFSHAPNVQVLYSNVIVRPLEGPLNVNADVFSACEISGTTFGGGGNFVASIVTATIDANLLKLNQGYWSFLGCTVFGAMIENTGSTVQAANFTFFGTGASGGGLMSYGANAFTDLSGNNGVFNANNGSSGTPGGVFVSQGSNCQLFTGSTLYGSGNTVGVVIDAGGQMQADPGVVPTITGANEVSIGNKATIPPLVGGVPTGPALPAVTWADLTAGFQTLGNYACVDLYTGARFSTPAF